MTCCNPSSFVRFLVLLLLLIGALLGTLYYFGFLTRTDTEKPIVSITPARIRDETPVPVVRSNDITKASGISFVHTNGLTDKKLLPETMCGGVAVIDFDHDDKPDILFVNACPWPGQEKPNADKPTLVLYRNLGNCKFQDVSKEAGLAVTMFGMGATVGDYDNDGWPDLF